MKNTVLILISLLLALCIPSCSKTGNDVKAADPVKATDEQMLIAEVPITLELLFHYFDHDGIDGLSASSDNGISSFGELENLDNGTLSYTLKNVEIDGYIFDGSLVWTLKKNESLTTLYDLRFSDSKGDAHTFRMNMERKYSSGSYVDPDVISFDLDGVAYIYGK